MEICLKETMKGLVLEDEDDNTRTTYQLVPQNIVKKAGQLLGEKKIEEMKKLLDQFPHHTEVVPERK